jgi:probable rRNA maturation factor
MKVTKRVAMVPGNSCVDIQYGENIESVPSDDEVTGWVRLVLQHQRCSASVSVRFVDEGEITSLNNQYRKHKESTNVLSFPCDLSDECGMRILGDIVVCEPVVNREALEQGKNQRAHWAHIVIHGLLHLLGFDHIDGQQAEEMECLEVSLLREIKVGNPYLESV